MVLIIYHQSFNILKVLGCFWNYGFLMLTQRNTLFWISETFAVLYYLLNFLLLNKSLCNEHSLPLPS